MASHRYDICVIGAGSGGFGAACAAARQGASVLLLEAYDGLGGTSTWAGVNNYEPVAGATGLPQEVYERLRQRPLAVCLQRRTHSYTPEYPFGRYAAATETDYRLSLSRRSGVPIAFEPDDLQEVMREMLAETGNCDLRLKTRFTEVDRDGDRIRSITAQGLDGHSHIEAAVFIDSTADIHLARATGCRSAIGPEDTDAYGEPSATSEGGLVLNNASPCYRISPLKPQETRQIQPPPENINLDELRPVTSIRTYANGDLNMNPLHLMSGLEALDLGEHAHDVAAERALGHWHVLQTQYGFDNWKLVWHSPRLGIRETHRLVGRYVLREQDLDAGLEAQEHDDIVAIADHAVDFHGARPSRPVPNGPYGIPFRCLLTDEVSNLIVACRGASFSSIGASSCRLSRTMMVLGQAAGTAAALFGDSVRDFDAAALRAQLDRDGVALDLQTGYLDAMPDVEPLEPPR
jgi:hypothetical protein